MSKKYSIPWLKDYFSFHWKGIPYQEDDKRKADCCRKRKEQQNIDAFLHVIRKCEGTDGANGYLLLFGYERFSDFSKHPNITINKSGYSSSAAGAYQILYDTWKTVIQPRASLPDFSPESQDEAAKVLIEGRDALDDAKAGRIVEATEKCSYEWASMPPGQYGQPVKTMEQVKRFFNEAGGIRL